MSDTYRSPRTGGRRQRALDAVTRAIAALTELKQLLEQPAKPNHPSKPRGPYSRRPPQRRVAAHPVTGDYAPVPAAPPCELHRYGFGTCSCPAGVGK
jgi:hypothetical protein